MHDIETAVLHGRRSDDVNSLRGVAPIVERSTIGKGTQDWACYRRSREAEASIALFGRFILRPNRRCANASSQNLPCAGSSKIGRRVSPRESGLLRESRNLTSCALGSAFTSKPSRERGRTGGAAASTANFDGTSLG